MGSSSCAHNLNQAASKDFEQMMKRSSLLDSFHISFQANTSAHSNTLTTNSLAAVEGDHVVPRCARPRPGFSDDVVPPLIQVIAITFEAQASSPPSSAVRVLGVSWGRR